MLHNALLPQVHDRRGILCSGCILPGTQQRYMKRLAKQQQQQHAKHLFGICIGSKRVNSIRSTYCSVQQEGCTVGNLAKQYQQRQRFATTQVHDRAGGLSAATGADPLLGHCRVPLYRLHRKRCEGCRIRATKQRRGQEGCGGVWACSLNQILVDTLCVVRFLKHSLLFVVCTYDMKRFRVCSGM